MFIDDHSTYGYIYLINKKSQALGKFKEYKYEVETQLERKIKTLHIDRGGEYTLDIFDTFCINLGIIH